MYSKDESKLLRKEFWIVFARRCELVPELRHKKKKWVLYDTGLSGIDLKFEVTRSQALVMIEINSKEEVRRLEIFEVQRTLSYILFFLPHVMKSILLRLNFETNRNGFEC